MHLDVGPIELASRSTLYIHIRHLHTYVFTVKIDHIRVTTIERLDQCHLHPKLEVQRLTCLGRESHLVLQEASTLEKSHTTAC
jgi:hypothetical protein